MLAYTTESRTRRRGKERERDGVTDDRRTTSDSNLNYDIPLHAADVNSASSECPSHSAIGNDSRRSRRGEAYAETEMEMEYVPAPRPTSITSRSSSLPSPSPLSPQSQSQSHSHTSSSPENSKTSHISAWRVAVARKRSHTLNTGRSSTVAGADEDTPRLSVYYVSADDYAVEMEPEVVRTIDQSGAGGASEVFLIDEQTRSLRLEGQEGEGEISDTVIASSSGNGTGKERESREFKGTGKQKPWAHVLRRKITEREMTATTTDPSSRSLSPLVQSREIGAPSIASIDTTSKFGKPRKTSTPMRHRLGQSHPSVFSSSSSRAHALPNANPIISRSNPSSEAQIFIAILGSCSPPLTHLASRLAQLGIRSRTHLCAIAKMSDETRDREVRAEALKRGVSVLEWAVLLDCVRGLESDGR